MKGLITLVFCAIVFINIQAYSQCTAGPFSVDPASALPLDCETFVVLTDPCFTGFDFSISETSVNVPAGTQYCVELPGSGFYQLGTCNLTADDTFLTIFDNSGNVIAMNDDGCGQGNGQSFSGFAGGAGDVICIQVESITNGICDGNNSISPSYEVFIDCPFSTDFIQEFAEVDVCPSTGFNEVQTLTTGAGLDGRENIFDFNTGTTSQMGMYTTGSVTICARDVFLDDEDGWEILDEDGNCIGGIGGSAAGNCPDEPVCTSFNLDLTEVQSLVADGIVTFDIQNFDDELDDCDNSLLSLELNLCVDSPPIPTMGEWGLISLGLILLSFSIVAIRQKQLLLN